MMGSSPPARGTQKCAVDHNAWLGLIPACAGNTPSLPALSHQVAAHPRLRGEHLNTNTHLEAVQGSSPPARGTHKLAAKWLHNLGLIPACAGNTTCATSGGQTRAAHPRLRGEHNIEERNQRDVAGSSPPARGTHVADDDDYLLIGLIPACAGNTRWPSLTRWRTTAHPRLRGEHPSPPIFGSFQFGSSPPARGTRPVDVFPLLRHGLIPACAGNTPYSSGITRPVAAHPRLRGEHSKSKRGTPEGAGSSPPARGTLAATSHPCLAGGLIPACAGNTLSPSAQ